MKVFVISPDQAESRNVVEAALRTSGHELINDACSLIGVTGKLNAQQPRPDVLLVRADIVQRDREDEMLNLLAAWPVIVLVPPGRSGRKAAIEALRQTTAPHVRGVLSVPPFDFNQLADLCQGSTKMAESVPQATVRAPQVAAPVSKPGAVVNVPANTRPTAAKSSTGPLRRQFRLGLYASRGGAGVSTAALKIAQALAGRGQHIALFDATGRGDLHVMLGHEPQSAVLLIGSLSVFLGAPTEELVRGFEAVIIDGGRAAGTFNARWQAITRPVNEQWVTQWTGVEEAPTRTVGLGRLLSIEVTD